MSDKTNSEDSSLLSLLLSRRKYDHENFFSSTVLQQMEVEFSITAVYQDTNLSSELAVNPGFPELKREATENYLLKILQDHSSYEVLDCNRAWVCYWALHSLSLFNTGLSDPVKSNIAKFLALCQNPDGGFGGGPGQLSHLAPTYAAVNALIIIGTEEAYKVVNRKTLSQFLHSLRVGDGSFYMHIGGEIDMRSTYCAISVAKLTNIFNDNIFEGTADWIVRCQSYEGGFSATPGMEAHGGYTFCGFSALYLLDCQMRCDIKSLLRWLTNRQMSFEGGFQGRTNKLVDSCYSFWQAGALAMVNMVLLSEGKGEEKQHLSRDGWLFDSNLLQEYVLICCQYRSGGLVDKPKKKPDSYHTCYALSGLSMAQNLPNGEQHSIGSEENILEQLHPAYNITLMKLMNSMQYFNSLENKV